MYWFINSFRSQDLDQNANASVGRKAQINGNIHHQQKLLYEENTWDAITHSVHALPLFIWRNLVPFQWTMPLKYIQAKMQRFQINFSLWLLVERITKYFVFYQALFPNVELDLCIVWSLLFVLMGSIFLLWGMKIIENEHDAEDFSGIMLHIGSAE